MAPQSVFSSEQYDLIVENAFKAAMENPLSTFSIDVDRAAYANVRRFLTNDQLPPMDAVRIEEMVNYFDYDYPQPKGDEPFLVSTKVAECPWNNDHQLALIGLHIAAILYYRFRLKRDLVSPMLTGGQSHLAHVRQVPAWLALIIVLVAAAAVYIGLALVPEPTYFY